jgi:hypothetical protein
VISVTEPNPSKRIHSNEEDKDSELAVASEEE